MRRLGPQRVAGLEENTASRLPAAGHQMGCTLIPVIFMTPVHAYKPDWGYKRCIQTLSMCVRASVRACVSRHAFP